MIEVKNRKLKIEGIYEETYREIVGILREYRKYLIAMRGEDFISDLLISRMIGSVMKENA